MLDTTLIFDGSISSAGVPTGAAITASRTSTNVLDFGVARDIGAGYKLEVVVDITQVFATLTSLQIGLQVSPDDSTWYDIMPSETFPVADLIVGAPIFRYTIPPNQGLNWTAGVLNPPGRYMQLNYTVGGSNATTGKVFAFINMTNDRTQYTSYAHNYVIRINAGQL
jgi:hypothetical protein